MLLNESHHQISISEKLAFVFPSMTNKSWRILPQIDPFTINMWYIVFRRNRKELDGHLRGRLHLLFNTYRNSFGVKSLTASSLQFYFLPRGKVHIDEEGHKRRQDIMTITKHDEIFGFIKHRQIPGTRHPGG